jgi:hypothetical protein
MMNSWSCQGIAGVNHVPMTRSFQAQMKAQRSIALDQFQTRFRKGDGRFKTF